MVQGAVVLMLALETVADIRSRKVSVIRLAIFTILGIVLNIVKAYQPVWSMIGGMAIGLLVILFAKISGEGIGYGDGVLFIASGAFLGLNDNLRLLFFSLIFAAVTGGICLLMRRKTIKSEIPFIPFVLGAYLVTSIVEVILQ